MNCTKIGKQMVIFAAMFALLIAVPAYSSKPQFPPFPKPPFSKAYPAQIDATGELSIKGFASGNLSGVTIDTNFTSVVPNLIQPGEYADVWFHGFAAATEEHLRVEGMLIVNGINFWVAFPVDRPQDLSEKMYSANGELDINITQVTLPPEKITMVMMKGNVTKFGERDAYGFLEASAKIGNRNFTKVHTTFSLQPPPRDEHDDVNGPKNFTISFYIVTLANATKTEIGYDGSALYVEGLWNVYNRTVTVTWIDHEEETTAINIKTLLEGASGKFNATLTPQTSASIGEGRWKTRGNFTLEIQGLTGMIKGDVIFYQAKFADLGDRDIPRSDFNQDHMVNILDINQLAKAFGAKLGTPKFDSDMDTNSDFVININDLVTTAQEFGQEY